MMNLIARRNTHRTRARNDATLALLAPLACPLIDLMCVAYVALARRAHAIIESLRADLDARRALATHRAAMLNPVQLPFAPSDYPLLGERDVIPPVLGDDDLIIEPALLRRLAELTADPTNADEVVTVAACQPIVDRAEWLPMTGLQHFSVKVDVVDPAPVVRSPLTGDADEFAKLFADIADDNALGRSSSDIDPAPECSHVNTTVPGFAPAVDVQHLTYRELQTLAKAAGIKANQSAAALRAALTATP